MALTLSVYLFSFCRSLSLGLHGELEREGESRCTVVPGVNRWSAALACAVGESFSLRRCARASFVLLLLLLLLPPPLPRVLRDRIVISRLRGGVARADEFCRDADGGIVCGGLQRS